MRKQHLDDVDPASRAGRKVGGAIDLVSSSSVGLEFGVSVVLCALVGRWLDTKAGTTPWLMLGFIVIGFAAGVRALLRYQRKLDRQAEATRKAEEDARG